MSSCRCCKDVRAILLEPLYKFKLIYEFHLRWVGLALGMMLVHHNSVQIHSIRCILDNEICSETSLLVLDVDNISQHLSSHYKLCNSCALSKDWAGNRTEQKLSKH